MPLSQFLVARRGGCIYRETRFVKMVTKAKNSVNSPVYTKEGYFSCLVLEEDQDFSHEPSFCQIKTEQPSENHEAGIWTLHFEIGRAHV